ncbi:MAG: nucleotidyltransferase family protein [Candidatus Omnitrophica bacterium]|nr:nucleotidyltransferase family protein [Candidatus Omnitrophota bacterium]
MKVLILAAGYATRLWPLTLNRPKPLLPIGRKSILDHILARVSCVKGIDEILIITNSKFVKNFKKWKKVSKVKQKISIVDDGMVDLDERRGSIGDIIFAVKKKRIRSDLLVIAGDNLFDFNIDDFVEKSRKRAPSASIGLYRVGNKALAKQYGIVGLDKNSKIRSFQEKPKRPKSDLAAMCLYYFPGKKLSMLKKYQAEGNPLDLAGGFIKWLSERQNVYGYIFEGRWVDIGDKRSLKKAQKMNWN